MRTHSTIKKWTLFQIDAPSSAAATEPATVQEGLQRELGVVYHAVRRGRPHAGGSASTGSAGVHFTVSHRGVPALPVPGRGRCPVGPPAPAGQGDRVSFRPLIPKACLPGAPTPRRAAPHLIPSFSPHRLTRLRAQGAPAAHPRSGDHSAAQGRPALPAAGLRALVRREGVHSVPPVCAEPWFAGALRPWAAAGHVPRPAPRAGALLATQLNAASQGAHSAYRVQTVDDDPLHPSAALAAGNSRGLRRKRLRRSSPPHLPLIVSPRLPTLHLLPLPHSRGRDRGAGSARRCCR